MMGISLFLIVLTMHPGPGDLTMFNNFHAGFIDSDPARQPSLLVDEQTEPDSPRDKKAGDLWFTPDKFWHWAMSFTLTGSAYHLLHNRLAQPADPATLTALAVVLGFGVSKELYDLHSYGLFSIKDLLYDLLGIVCGYFVFIY